MSTSETSIPWRRFARGLYLVVCNTLLVVLAAEIACRACVSRDEPRSAAQTPRTSKGVPYTLHPFLQMANRPAADVDAGPSFSGWRVDPPDAAFADGRLRVMFLGGSTTATAYPNFVRAALEREIGPVTIYNFGADWLTSLHSLYQFWTYVDVVEPDLVIVLHNVNDFGRGFTPPAYALPQFREDYSHYAGALNSFWVVDSAAFDERPAFRAIVKSKLQRAGDVEALTIEELVHGSALVQALQRALQGDKPPRATEGERRARVDDQKRVPMNDEVLLRSLPAFRRHMQNLRVACRTKGVPVVFLTMPFTIDTPTPEFLGSGRVMSNDGETFMTFDDFAKGMRAFNAAVLELDDGAGARAFDLAAQIVDPHWFQDEVHLTDEGLPREGEAVASFVLAQGLAKRR